MLAIDPEAQFAQLAPQLARIGLIEERTTLGQQVDVPRGVRLRLIVERAQPRSHLRMNLDLTPAHVTNDIS